MAWWLVSAWALPGGVVPAVVRAGAAPSAVCRQVVPEELELCLRVREGPDERWLTAADLTSWRMTPDRVWGVIERRAGKRLRASMHEITVEGTDASYWQADSGDGWAGAIFLRPDLAVEWLGPDLRVGAPSMDVVLAWTPNASELRMSELDLVMAVGVQDMYRLQDGPVHDGVFRLGPAGWLLMGRAIQP